MGFGSVVLTISKGVFLLTAMGEGILSELTKNTCWSV